MLDNYLKLSRTLNLNLQSTPDGLSIIGPHDTKGRKSADIQTRSNVYLLTEESKAVLIDSGLGNEFYEKLKKIIRKLDVDLKFIVLTHFHYDHIGAAQDLADDFDAAILAHEKDLPYIENPLSILSYGIRKEDLKDRRRELNRINTITEDEIKKLYPTNLTVDESLRGGEELDLGNKKLMVLSTPGHTPGSISLYVDETSSLYVSDLDYCVNPALPPDLGNSKLLKSSLRKVIQLDASFLGSGHLYNLYGTKMIKDYLKKTLNTQLELTKNISELLARKSSPLTLKEIVNHLYPVTPRFAYEPILSFSVLCHLHELTRESRVEKSKGAPITWRLP